MNIPKQTGRIFDMLSSGQFICSNSADSDTTKLYDVIDDADKYEILYDYFFVIGFTLERGDEFYYFSRKNESKADLERKLETACKWIDILDFFKTFDNAFGSGYSFSPQNITVEIKVNAVLKNKADALRKVLRMDDKTPYDEVVAEIIKNLCKDGFAEQENEILKSYKILSSFKYLEELVTNINIPEEVQNEIPE
jgi:hypothetical protein